jgi:hypothetical protein
MNDGVGLLESTVLASAPHVDLFLKITLSVHHAAKVGATLACDSGAFLAPVNTLSQTNTKALEAQVKRFQEAGDEHMPCPTLRYSIFDINHESRITILFHLVVESGPASVRWSRFKL